MPENLYQISIAVDNALRTMTLSKVLETIEPSKARIGVKVEHPFHLVKELLKYKKTRYRGMAKNASKLMTRFGLANLLLAKQRLTICHVKGAS